MTTLLPPQLLDEILVLLRHRAAIAYGAFILLTLGIELLPQADVGITQEMAQIPASAMGLVGLALLWFVVRAMAGDLTGRGRLGLWLAAQLGLLLLVFGVPIVLTIAYAYAVLDNPAAATTDPVLLLATACGVVLLTTLLLPLWVRVDSLAISGDRVRLAQVMAGLAPSRLAAFGLYGIAAALAYLPTMAAFAAGWIDQESVSWIDAAIILIETMGTLLLLAISVALYCRIDRSGDLDALRSTFA